MPAPRTTLTAFLSFALLACACLVMTGARAWAQSPPQASPPKMSDAAARGAEMYRAGDFAGAVQVLKQVTEKDKDDADAWRFLGLAYEKLGKHEDALKASEMAVALSLKILIPKPAPSGVDFSKQTQEERAAHRLKFSEDCLRAAEIVGDYLRLQPDGADFWRAQLESLRFHGEEAAKPFDQASVFFTSELKEGKAKLLTRSEPLYTKEARSRQVRGDIIVRFVLAADGTVRHILVLEFLPYGLTEQAIAAARIIKFTPAMKDGRPVSQFTMMEYNFNVY
jgi:TonB family protein